MGAVSFWIDLPPGGTELADEVARLEANAERAASASFGYDEEGGVVSPYRFSYVSSGPDTAVLNAVHAGLRRSLAGALEVDLTMVRPSRASFNIYRAGDHITLHLDEPSCRFACLVLVRGEVGPLHLYPDLRGLPAAAVADLAAESEGVPPGGVELALDRTRAAVIEGSAVPHARPRAASSAVVATFCYDVRPAA